MRSRVLLLGIIVVCAFAVPTDAVVNQINGMVVPILDLNNPCPGDITLNGCIQTGLNYGEGINPPNDTAQQPGPVDAILDANISPETFFIPTKTSGDFRTVKVRLIQETAGFENIFGWYNVGEPDKRFPAIFSNRNGQWELYEPPTYSIAGNPYSTLNPGYELEIDFQAEYLAGRYKGKQVGFYLVTPKDAWGDPGPIYAVDDHDLGILEGGAPSGPVDDDNDGLPDDMSTYGGRVYFTQNKLNFDGNYVHYLIYQGKNEEHFYFGFEDLFRGGDNDFEDVLVKVEGLIPACKPEQEICNGLDDNCNGDIDENLFRPCASACGTGQEQCVNGSWVGCTAPPVGPEKCDGLDNDCNGVPDDNLPPGDLCVVAGCEGIMECVGGSWVCNAPAPSTEICDGKDNNCDGNIDENLVRPCLSECGPGIQSCTFTNDGDPQNDWSPCSGKTGVPEECDGKDNDCNGVVDDGLPDKGECAEDPTGKPIQNICKKGVLRCVGGSYICVGATTAYTEVCDCLDNDCDTLVDEDDTCPPSTKCITTKLATGQPVCGCRKKCGGVEFGCPANFICKNDYCVPDECAAITCQAGEECINGQCVKPCRDEACPTGMVCKDRYCVEDNCYGLGCPGINQLCWEGSCIEDLCQTTSCGPGEYCKKGECRKSCGPATCGENGLCIDGLCHYNPCAGVYCAGGVKCHEGRCDTGCQGISCGAGRMCRDGQCIDDPCKVVRCYEVGEFCQSGQCVSAKTFSGTLAQVLATGGGGASCSVSGAQAAPGLLPLVGLLLLALRRRRRPGPHPARQGGGR